MFDACARILVAILVLVAAQDWTWAAPCGDTTGARGTDVPCSCGDTVMTNTVLDNTDPVTSNICLGTGLTLSRSIELDGNGHTIVGAGKSGTWGIYLAGASNATVRNCTAENFQIGIRLSGVTNCNVENCVAKNNTTGQPNEGYGIEITQSSSGVRVSNSTVNNNGDEGIHISGTSGSGHHILNNFINNNALEGVYLLNSNGNRIFGNFIHAQNAAGVYIKNSDQNTIKTNTFSQNPIQLTDGSEKNIISNNTMIESKIKTEDTTNNTIKYNRFNKCRTPHLVTIKHPNGSESWIIGSEKEIRWSSEGGASCTRVKIELSTDAGTHWQVVKIKARDDGSFNWVVNANPTNQALMRITTKSNPLVVDVSDDVFTIEESSNGDGRQLDELF